MPKIIKRPVRVLLLIHGSGLTGPGRCVSAIAKYIDRKEFLLNVLCPGNGYLADDLRGIGVEVVPFETKRLWSPGSIFYALAVLRKKRCHIFHVNSGQLNTFSRIVGKLLGVPVIIVTEHLCAESHVWIKNKTALLAHIALQCIPNMMVDKVIAVSEAAKDAFIERQNIDPKKVVTIHNGVDLAERENHKTDCRKIRALWGIPENALVVGIVGRLSYEKGHKTLILAAGEVLKKADNAKFLIVGDGPEKPHIEELIEKLGIKDSCILTGFQEDIYSLVDIMDIVVQPSLDKSESFGLSVIEAMASGKPVIASNIACFGEIIEDNKNGILFAFEDHLKLAEEIVLLRDAKLRAELGASARETVRKNFDVRIMVKKVESLYKKTLHSKGFYIEDDYLEIVTADFLNSLKIERGIQDDKLNIYRGLVRKYLLFVKGRRLLPQEAAGYLDGEDNFLIDMFLQFTERNKPFMDEISIFNNMLFRRLVREKKVTSRDYDERIKMQPLQFQVSSYYLPEDESQKRRLDIILSALRPKACERILDLGCGVGSLAYHCAKRGADAVGIDYSQESVRIAEQLITQFGLSEKVKFKCCDAAKKLPYDDGYFDKIVAGDFIEHIDDAEKKASLSEIARVLKPDGTIVIFTPNGLRERLGSIKSKLLTLSGAYVSETRLHYGLTNRFIFEKMLRDANLSFKRQFFDVTRPYLAKIPLLNEFLSLNILWVIKKKT